MGSTAAIPQHYCGHMWQGGKRERCTMHHIWYCCPTVSYFYDLITMADGAVS